MSPLPPTFETTCRIDLPDGESRVSVRVEFNGGWIHPNGNPDFTSYLQITVSGVYRCDNDAEVDYHSLAGSEQQKIDEACEREYDK